MKFCFITPEFSPYIGGIAHVTFGLSSELIRRGHHVTVITRPLGRDIRHEYFNGIEIFRIKSLFPKLVYVDYAIFTISAFFLLMRLKVDILHAQSILPFGLLTGVVGKLKKIICIIQTHGKDINRDLILNKWTRPFSIWALKHNDILIAVCNYHKEKIQEYVKKEVFILAHGQLPIDLKITREQAIKELKINKNYFNLLFVGRLIPSKGADLLVKAAQAISDCFVRIIGDGPEKNNLQKLVREYGMEDRVLFHNVLPREEALKYMKACDLFVFPTHKEAFGLVILEAMEMKLPIICSNAWDTGGPKDILENEVDALLVPRDYYSFRKGIIRLKNNRELAIKLAENAFLKAKNYSWERVSYKYLEIIRCAILLSREKR